MCESIPPCSQPRKHLGEGHLLGLALGDACFPTLGESLLKMSRSLSKSQETWPMLNSSPSSDVARPPMHSQRTSERDAAMSH